MADYDKVNELNLREIIAGLWANKIIILIVCCASIAATAVYLSKLQRIYTAQSVFILNKNDSSSGIGSALSSQLGGLALISGLSGVSSSTNKQLIERVKSREFILEVSEELNLKNDSFFNSYDPSISSPGWKILVKNFLGMQTLQPSAEQASNWNVIESFKKRVTIEETKAGSIRVTVDHIDPPTSAIIANHLAEKIISLYVREAKQFTDNKLNYLSQNLADALEEFEQAKLRLKEYALNNSIIAVESLQAQSILLDDLRSRLQESGEKLQALNALAINLELNQDEKKTYEQIRILHPIIDNSDFRRILGISEIVSAWTWPSANSLDKVAESISDRIMTLKGELATLEAEAKRTAETASEQDRLNRDAKIAEATYTVLMEQVKSQSIVASFELDNAKIIELADTPISATEPQPKVLLALGLIAGIIAGCATAFIVSIRNSVFYSSQNLIEASAAQFNHKVNISRNYKRKNLEAVGEAIQRSTPKWPQQVMLECGILKNKNTLLVVNLANETEDISIGNIIAATGARFSNSIALINLARYVKASELELEPIFDQKLIRTSKYMGANEYSYSRGHQNIDMVYIAEFNEIVSKLHEKHDMVIFTLNREMIDAVFASDAFKLITTVAILRSKSTKREDLTKLLKLTNIKAALYA